MNKAVLISIQPKWCELIASGKKTIEVRKTRPSIKTPFKVYIYQTKKKWIYRLLEKLGLYQRKVVGEFVCDKIYQIKSTFRGYMVNDDIALTNRIGTASCLDLDDMRAYLGNKNGYAWHISNLVIYDKPKELGEFYKVGKHAACAKGERTCDRLRYTDFCRTCKFEIRRPPQSWQYIEA